MMTLSTYLQKQNAVTGPLVKNTSHSHLESLKKLLHGYPLMMFHASYDFGTALHELYLENKIGDAYKSLDQFDQVKVEKMVDALNRHPVAQRLKYNSVKEDKQYGDLFELVFAYILDMDQRKIAIGSDLKSTACKTYEDCCKKYILYGYYKQGWLYKKLTNKKQFFFIFISKQPPYKIFILNTEDFKMYDSIAEKEIKFLAYFYKHYGNLPGYVTPPIQAVAKTIKRKENGATSKTNNGTGKGVKKNLPNKSKTIGGTESKSAKANKQHFKK